MQSTPDKNSPASRSDVGVARPMSRRTPSILVTDSRNSMNRRSAPFAGSAAGKPTSLQNRSGSARRNDQTSAYNRKGPFGTSYSSLKNQNSSSSRYQGMPAGYSRQSGPFQGQSRSRRGSVNSMDQSSYSGLGQVGSRRRSSNYNNITMDKILSDVSDVPSGRPEERARNQSFSSSTGYSSFRNHYAYSKFRNPRTSKTSEKLVLIPDDVVETHTGSVGKPLSSNFKQTSLVENIHRDPADYSRITAFNVSEAINLKLLSKCLRKTHGISTRLYDECLYALYCLPLLSGENGFRIKSSPPKTTKTGEIAVDKYLDKNEQLDHHYEYYSGIETVEHRNNNYDIKTAPGEDSNTQNNNNSNSSNNEEFDPSEPQFFAENTTDSASLSNRHLHPSSSNVSSDSETSTSNSDEKHAEIFIFNYGVIVFWNFTEEQEKNILADIGYSEYYESIIINPSDEQKIETEEYFFEYDKEIDRPRILNDIVTLKSGDHIIKLTLSHAMAQSCRLSKFETRMIPILTTVTKLPKRLALYGKLGMTRQKLLKKFGKLFKLRVDVNLSSNILDTPDFFWSSEPSLDPLYMAMREYLEIDERVQVLNEKCRVFLEFVDICVDSIAEKNMTRITRWIITVFFISLVVSILEIFIRYLIIQKNNALTHK
ncbi:hypothetical protein ACO0QE_000913 [Hanseniaspora vineae]